MVQDRYLSECDDNKLDKSVSDVVKLLKQRNWKIASAESCTGGFVSQMITSVSGASSVFELGLCTYSDRMKHNLLGVPEEILQKYGAVSPQTAEAMVRGLHKKSGADVCISVTGIAGPDGGTEKTPVGTVYIGFWFDGRCFVRLPELWELDDKSRKNIRLSAVKYAFETVENLLSEDSLKNE